MKMIGTIYPIQQSMQTSTSLFFITITIIIIMIIIINFFSIY